MNINIIQYNNIQITIIVQTNNEWLECKEWFKSHNVYKGNHMNKLGEYLSYGWHRCTMRSSLSWMCTNVFNLLVRLKKCVDSD
jgi:hypothetical protein